MVQHKRIIIVGAGPSGIGLGILLEKLGFDSYVILEADVIGSSFLHWPAEMKLITPSFTGQGFGALDLNAITPGTSPAYSFRKEHLTGEEYSDYLNLLADHFHLNVEEEQAVLNVTKANGIFTLQTSKGTWTCDALIWATGEFHFPNTDGIKGAEYGLRNGFIDSYKELERGNRVVIGGGESGMDAAYHLSQSGSQVTVLLEGRLKDFAADPSRTISPYTFERIQQAVGQGSVKFVENVKVTKIEQQGGQYEVYLQDGQVISTSLQPILATGFHSGAKQMEAFFEWKGNGKPQLSEEADESTLVNNLFVAGPSVEHDSAVFCFIYKFRARFAVIIKHLLTKWGEQIDDDVMSEYRDNQMLLEDLSCCEVDCEC
ncbi:NAD(P)/FAD-dependent oxidoreductase [Shouchella clausii]|uniref:NAD(P)/FAD-dependent oxidoreductase n=1 Tax=Shouchella clausii TaxID=79880 RepID=UPI000BA4FA1C|nr:NAD(P)/FAD-dependent oxidoreductase [Shouchella clausii]PAD92389.1 NAD-binding site protein [Shouchella clausii]